MALQTDVPRRPFCRGRRGFYFSLDVLLFLFIIAFGTVLVLAALPGRAPKTQPLTIADSLTSFLATTKTRNIIEHTKGITFTSLDRTILEQAIVFIETGREKDAQTYITQIIEGTNIVPETYMASVDVCDARLDACDVTLYHRTEAGRQPSDSNFLISAKRIILFYDKESNKVLGPDVVRVNIW